MAKAPERVRKNVTGHQLFDMLIMRIVLAFLPPGDLQSRNPRQSFCAQPTRQKVQQPSSLKGRGSVSRENLSRADSDTCRLAGTVKWAWLCDYTQINLTLAGLDAWSCHFSVSANATTRLLWSHFALLLRFPIPLHSTVPWFTPMKITAYKSHDRTALQHPLWSLPAFEGKNGLHFLAFLAAISENFIKILHRVVAKSNP